MPQSGDEAAQRLREPERAARAGSALVGDAAPPGATPAAFARRTPGAEQRWFCTVAAGSVELVKDDLHRRAKVWFRREAFLVEGKLPRPPV